MQRRERGAVLLTLMGGAVAFIILLSLGVFSFEAMRAYTCRDELRSACEAAALAAAAALASAHTNDSAEAHLLATNAAIRAFNANSVVGFPLRETAQVGNETHVPPREMSSIFIQYLDPSNNNQPTTGPDFTNGTNVRVVGAFTLTPAFGIINMDIPVRAEAHGRTPTLDLVMCFDISGSIDDETMVTFVRRRWDSANNRIVYDKIPARPGSIAAGQPGGLAQGRLLHILMPPATGTGVNAIWPQNLSGSNNSGHGGRLRWRQDLWNNMNSPPGNTPPLSISPPLDTYDYSDLVVNLDGRRVFERFTHNGFEFPDIATLVEAARGNLENPGLFISSRANTGVPSTVVPRAGYQAAYMAAAEERLEPIGPAKRAARRFFEIMNNNTDAHFGFISFRTAAHTNPTDNRDAWRISSGVGGIVNLPCPGIPLSNSQSRFNDIASSTTGAIARTRLDGATNIGDAIRAATNWLAGSQSRTQAKRAIIVFTDGMDTVGSDPKGAADDTARTNKGIAIYTIGLAQTPNIIPPEVETLNDGAGTTYNYINPITGANDSYTASTNGVAARAGNGGRFFLVTKTENLEFVFENIARHLVQLSRQGN